MNAVKNAMAWIKKNYDQFTLAVVSFLLLAISGFIIFLTINFPQTFDAVRAQPIPNNNVPKLDLANIEAATKEIDSPATWNLTPTTGSLFVSIPYIANADSTLTDPRTSQTPLHSPVPNKWIIENKLDILDNNVLNEDPSGDGFTNLDKWMGTKGDGSDASDPQDKTSHPPYWTKLRLVQYIKQPFRLRFESYDGDAAKPDSMDFQVNALDAGGATQFLHMGDIIAGTKFKLIKFEAKNTVDPNTQSSTDVSELTIQNTETEDKIVLVLQQVADSPDSYADFRYLWNNTEITVKKGRPFVLLPEPDRRYILIDITEDNAVIQTPDGHKVTIPKLQ